MYCFVLLSRLRRGSYACHPRPREKTKKNMLFRNSWAENTSTTTHSKCPARPENYELSDTRFGLNVFRDDTRGRRVFSPRVPRKAGKSRSWRAIWVRDGAGNLSRDKVFSSHPMRDALLRTCWVSGSGAALHYCEVICDGLSQRAKYLSCRWHANTPYIITERQR